MVYQDYTSKGDETIADRVFCLTIIKGLPFLGWYAHSVEGFLILGLARKLYHYNAMQCIGSQFLSF